jgi:hypothetical protein
LSEQTNTEAELSEFDKQQLAEEARKAQVWATVQERVRNEAEVKRRWNSPGTLDREFVRSQCGFDPGWSG